MKVYNLFNNNSSNLELHKDHRGLIADIFYNADINHVAIVSSLPDVIRGNHYHKETTQHIFITKGSLEYWYKPVGSNEPPKVYVANYGDLISTEPYEIHTLKIGSDGNEFIVFSSGKRGGKDYESDTYRVESII